MSNQPTIDAELACILTGVAERYIVDKDMPVASAFNWLRHELERQALKPEPVVQKHETVP